MIAGTLASAYGGNKISFRNDASPTCSRFRRSLYSSSFQFSISAFTFPKSTALHPPIQKCAGAITGNPASAASASAIRQPIQMPGNMQLLFSRSELNSVKICCLTPVSLAA